MNTQTNGDMRKMANSDMSSYPKTYRFSLQHNPMNPVVETNLSGNSVEKKSLKKPAGSGIPKCPA